MSIVRKTKNESVIKLEDLVEIIIPSRINSINKEVSKGEEILVVSQTHFAKAGFTTHCGKIETISDENSMKYRLKPYDILIAKHGTPFKVAVIGEITQDLFALDNLYILRFKNIDNIKENAINLYMYLKSNKVQEELGTISKGTHTQILSKTDLLGLDISYCHNTRLQMVENFHKEQRLFNDIYEAYIKIHKINQFFDDKEKVLDLGVCKMCKKAQATHLRIDTWKPQEKGIPMCDKCSQNIMF